MPCSTRPQKRRARRPDSLFVAAVCRKHDTGVRPRPVSEDSKDGTRWHSRNLGNLGPGNSYGTSSGDRLKDIVEAELVQGRCLEADRTCLDWGWYHAGNLAAALPCCVHTWDQMLAIRGCREAPGTHKDLDHGDVEQRGYQELCASSRSRVPRAPAEVSGFLAPRLGSSTPLEHALTGLLLDQH